MAGHTNDTRIEAALAKSIELGETGIAVAAYHNGELIVDAFAGIADRETGRQVDGRSLYPVSSVTKGVTALAVHMQADRGLLELDAPISRYWPELAAAGKESTTAEQALSHQAGIPQMPAGLTPELMANWDWMVEMIAEFTPIYSPGTANAYHVLVWGWILGEVVCRTDPKKRRLKKRLSDVVTLYRGNSFPIVDNHGVSPASVFPGSDIHNLPIVQQCVDPGAGAITTASAIARIFALIANGGELDGVRLLSNDRVKNWAN